MQRLAHERRALFPTLATETRRITAQLTVNYTRGLYVLEDTVANRRLRGATALIREAVDGTVAIHGNGHTLPYRLHPRDQAQLVPGVVVEHQHLDGVFAWIAPSRANGTPRA